MSGRRDTVTMATYARAGSLQPYIEQVVELVSVQNKHESNSRFLK